MNQNYIDQVFFTKQFYRAFGNYFGPHTSTPSIASEYLSSTRTQTANLNKQNSLAKPITSPQSVRKPIHQNFERVKTQTQHISKQQPIVHHIKSLSSDLKNQPQQKRFIQQKIISYSESEQHPFLIIQKKARELRKIESRKSILPSIYNDSQHSARLLETPPLLQIPIIQITEPLEQHSSKGQEYESDKDDDSLDEEDFPQGQQRMKKLSVRLKFKNAVQSQVSTLFINKQPKSLFNVIISPEFTLKHEEERQKISDAFEAGNFILYKAKQFQHKEVTNKKKLFVSLLNMKHPHKINNIVNSQIAKLNTTNKAFRRKIKMILTTTENNKEIEQPQKFSFLSKYKKSQFGQQGTNEHIAQGINLNKDQFIITITNDKLENEIQIFQRPKFLIQIDQVNEELQLALSPPKLAKSPSRRVLTHSGSLHQSQKHINLRHSISQQIIKVETSNIQIVPNIEENHNLDFNQEFSKSNLYVRLYYQSKLHKLPRKTTFTGMNLQEIEDYFTSQQQLIKLTNINFQVTEVPGFEQLGQVLQQNLEIPKYIIYKPKLCLDINLDQTQTFSSSESDQSLSLDLLLEEPIQSLILNKFRPGSQQQQESGNQMVNKKQSLNNLDKEKDQTIFIEDDFKNLKSLSTGQLTLIKKARNNFLQPLEFRCILSTLDQNTKNQLLTFPQKAKPINEMLNSLYSDNDSGAFNQLEQYNNQEILKLRIVFQLEVRYEGILVGRYQDYKKIIDIEHQDLIETLQNLPEIPKLKEIEYQSKSQKSQMQQQQQYQKQQQKQQPQQIVKTDLQIRQIAQIKKNLHNKTQLKKNQTQTINVQPNLRTKQTSNSPDQNNSKLTMQYSNQLTNQQTQNNNNNNIITQSTTQYLTKPTNQSQQSVNISGSKTIQKSKSNADLSETSSIKSSNSRLEISSQQIIDVDNQKHQPKIQQFQELPIVKKLNHHHTKSENLINKIFEQKIQSMQQHALRMRSHAEEQTKRQKYDQKYQVKFAIEDNNFQEFMENFISLPEMYIDYRFQNNDTFLTLATQSGNKEIVKELIRRGADINIQNVFFYQKRMMEIPPCIWQQHILIILQLTCQCFQEPLLTFQISREGMRGIEINIKNNIVNLMNKGAEKKRTSSFNKQTINQIYDRYDTQQKQFYCPKQKKDVKNLINNLKLKSSYESTLVMISQNDSLKNVLNGLTNKSPKRLMKKYIKKTPSTSLHTPADFTIRNTEQQSELAKQQQSILNQQSQQISYRSLLQHNKRNQWVDLINQKSSNYIQQDQIAITEYQAQQDIQMTNNCDWKQPYTYYKEQRHHSEMQIIENLEFDSWKELMMTRIVLRQQQ
ncbi:unnamed protein product [Paramecium primaurelia]|uniref:Uncharacterized protein n=1 Tax=Paramecium primaurelia TaxID=5886 RepID=A0A8S1LA38_PARPR|nr:unnamed protein product [Paramecium primaurelia]